MKIYWERFRLIHSSLHSCAWANSTHIKEANIVNPQVGETQSKISAHPFLIEKVSTIRSYPANDVIGENIKIE